MKRTLSGNLVLPDRTAAGSLEITGSIITAVTAREPPVHDAPWILPGFVNIHFHGLGRFGMLGLESLKGVAGFSPGTGVTSFTPTLASCSPEDERDFLENVKALVRDPPPGARCSGSHLEGPYLSAAQKGGMAERCLRTPAPREIQDVLRRSDGTLRMVTLAPEIPGGLEATRLLHAAGVAVALGHSACPPALFPQAVDAGISHVCHLFDAYEGRSTREGIVQTSLADQCLLDDRVTVELIVDGLHVPPPLLRLAIRCAGPGRIVAVTDSLQGTGLPNATYTQESGEEYYLDNDSLCRMTEPPHGIVGSCLTMLKALRNLVRSFDVPLVEASRMLSRNPAHAIGTDHQTGSLQEGLLADLVVLSPADLDLQETIVAGNTAFRSEE